mmetsp:Transcript_3948/g.9227  ORF Transcript_3948/g.9227 Transcript_3948/m.9227 type:complete len:239 (+) Transcript_3948:682-1398(+)
MVSDTDLPWTSVLVTLVPSLKSKPCFFSVFWNIFAISESTPGTMRSRNSTTVTLDPRRLHTEPISSPITPAPITTRCSGTFFNSKAPVESTTTPPELSTGAGGRGVGSDPVAMMTFFALRVAVPPSSRSATTVLEPSKRPLPLTYVTLFFLNRPSMPPVRPLTLFSLAFIIFFRSKLTLSTVMPCALKSCWAWCNMCEECKRDFEGMQPTLRQVPPREPRISTQAVFKPSCAALIAAT